MNVLVDVNVFMDVLQAREGVRSSLRAIVLLRKQEEHRGFVSNLTVPILYYLESQKLSEREARRNVERIIEGFELIDLTAEIIRVAFREERLPDFEDCIQYHSAEVAQCEAIITRNTEDFGKVELKIYTPEEFLTQIKSGLEEGRG